MCCDPIEPAVTPMQGDPAHPSPLASFVLPMDPAALQAFRDWLNITYQVDGWLAGVGLTNDLVLPVLNGGLPTCLLLEVLSQELGALPACVPDHWWELVRDPDLVEMPVPVFGDAVRLANTVLFCRSVMAGIMQRGDTLEEAARSMGHDDYWLYEVAAPGRQWISREWLADLEGYGINVKGVEQ